MRGFSTRAAGLLVLLGGLWGGLAPFIGPYWHFTLGPDKTWTWTTGRLWLDVLPGAVAVLAGLMLMSAGPRPHARLGALLGLAAGIWFTVGPAISELWTTGGAQGVGHGAAHTRMLENLTFHTGLGVLMAAIAAYILPRFPARKVVAEGAAVGTGAAARRGYAEDDRGYAANERGDAANERSAGTTRHRGRDLAAGAAAGGVAGAAMEHHHDRRVEERNATADDRTMAVADDRTGDGFTGNDDRDRTSVLGGEGGDDRAAGAQTAGAQTAGAQTAGAQTGGAQTGGAQTTGMTTARDDATTVGETTPDGMADDQSATAGQAGGGTIADRRETVRRRRGGLLGMLTRR